MTVQKCWEMIPFSPPHIDRQVVDEVSKVLLSGWITTGAKTKEFESEITSYTGSQRTLCVNSATAGLELVAAWFGLKEGDEVIVPAYTYCATANVALHFGARPVMVDIHPEDFTLSLDAIEQHISERTKIILPVDIAGWPCDYKAIHDLVNRPAVKRCFRPETSEQSQLGRILVVSDAAHSFGAVQDGKRAGTLTDITVFSFHAVKNLTTAEGGAICFQLPPAFDSAAIYRQLAAQSLHGQSKDALTKTTTGNWKYDVVAPGYKYNMTDIQAAMGLVALGRYEATLQRRKAIFHRYAAALGTHPWAVLPPFQNDRNESAYHLFLLRIKAISEQQRDRIIEGIFRREVSVNVHFQPLPLFTAYKERGYQMNHYPEAYRQYAQVITLPVYFNLSDADVARVCQAVTEAVEEVLSN